MKENCWLDKKEIMEKYCIGVTTYKRRIKKLNNKEYQFFTKFIDEKIPNSNLGYIRKRYIHKDILDKLFGGIRVPDKKNKDNVVKWVVNQDWDWFGNIIPSKTYPYELKDKMVYFFKQLKKISKSKNCLIIFYSIEQNTKDNYFHTHFLIKSSSCGINHQTMRQHLEVICEENTPNESRIHLRKYDEKYGNKGKQYSLKNMKFGFDILK